MQLVLLSIISLSTAISYPNLLSLHPDIAKSTFLEVENSRFGKLLLDTIQLQVSNSKGMDSAEELLNEIQDVLNLKAKEMPQRKAQYADICKKQRLDYDSITEKCDLTIASSQKRISIILPLLDDAATYVPEKEQEVEQAKRWSETAWQEVDKENIRFAERDQSYKNSIEACNKALQLLEYLHQNQGVSIGESSKIASSLLEISKSFEENSEDEFSPLAKVLLELSVSHDNISNPENLTKIMNLIKSLKNDLEGSRDIIEENHQQALKGAIAYADEKRYTFYNLNRQDNIILDNQIVLQQELYQEQLKIKAETTTKERAQHKLELLNKWCDAEDAKFRSVSKDIESELEICLNLKHLSTSLGSETQSYLNKRP